MPEPGVRFNFYESRHAHAVLRLRRASGAPVTGESCSIASGRGTLTRDENRVYPTRNSRTGNLSVPGREQG